MGAVIGLLAGAALLAFSIKGRAMTNDSTDTGPELRYFQPSEFGPWWPMMNRELLFKLDEFRHRWGAPVIISPANGSLGRHQGGGGESQHNVDAWGEVRAVDVFPKVNGRYMTRAADRRRAYEIAREVGFTGVGLYTDTQPGNMLHVDVRNGNRVATWSRVGGDYLDIGQVV
ncbi:hypothetical protein [Marinobacter salarius]|uniref:hypothetical protein n=1 Tax=Marinobacter salarius TaxID=1420917 RepID=UPI003D0A0201